MKKIAICLAAVMFLGISCSEDVEVNPELAGPLYGLTKGEPGSVDELIYKTWEEWGMYYLYDYEPYAFQVSNWNGSFERWYTPMNKENKELIRKLIDIVQNGIFVGMDKELLKGSWYVRTFLCDSLCSTSDYSSSDVVEDYLENGDCIIFPGFGERMQGYTDEDWSALEEKLSALLLNRLYLGAKEQPDEFFDLRLKKSNGDDVTSMMALLGGMDIINDPSGKYSPNMYTFRLCGYVRSKSNSFQSETILIVDRQTDLADYISFLTKTEKAELEYNFQTFPKMLQRAAVLVPYLMRVLSMNLDAMQQANCPDDPVEDGYFANLKYTE
ncbi:MAG: hypothetical protein K2O69_07150 [Odoribacter sp.]|nr:hypothetical protein [Odoribacter sp.]